MHTQCLAENLACTKPVTHDYDKPRGEWKACFTGTVFVPGDALSYLEGGSSQGRLDLDGKWAQFLLLLE